MSDVDPSDPPSNRKRRRGAARVDRARGGGPGAAPSSAEAGDRIAKVLSRAGVASRRDAERLIEAGRVAVNGRRLDSPAVRVVPSDLVEVDGRPIAEPGPPRLWRYHKPAGVVTSARDEQGRTDLSAALPEGLPRVMPVGRLDLSSEGLLLLTNDGELKRSLELPAAGWLRRYKVRVRGRPSADRLAPLEEGIAVPGPRGERVLYQPMEINLDPPQSGRAGAANAWLTVGLREGRNREIRRAMEAVGLSVNRLIRIAYGPFQLGDLPAGAVDEVRAKALRAALGVAAESPAARERRNRPARRAET